MAIYTLDQRSITGVKAIDDAHREIAELFGVIAELAKNGGDFDKVRETFEALADVMRDHFVVEEQYMSRLPATPEVTTHIANHKQNHQVFRDTLVYAEDMFKQNAGRKIVPNIIELIPDHYIEELKDLDAEMAELFRKNGLV